MVIRYELGWIHGSDCKGKLMLPMEAGRVTKTIPTYVSCDMCRKILPYINAFLVKDRYYGRYMK
jgi:hypothetical protein